MSDKIVFIGCDGDGNLSIGFDTGFHKKVYGDEGESFITYEFDKPSAMLTGGKEACRHELKAEDFKELLGEIEPGQVAVLEIKPIAIVDVKNPSETEYFKTIAPEYLMNKRCVRCSDREKDCKCAGCRFTK